MIFYTFKDDFLYNAIFPFAGKNIVMVSNGSKTYTVDFKKHKLLSEMDFADGENLLEDHSSPNPRKCR